MRVLRDHGPPATSLTDVFRATIIAKLTYCSPEWSGLTSAQDRARIDAFLRRSKRYGYCADSVPITDIFRRILDNESHVLHQLLPEKTNCTYNLRSRQHDRQLTRKSTHIDDSLFLSEFWSFLLRFVNVLYTNIWIWICTNLLLKINCRFCRSKKKKGCVPPESVNHIFSVFM